MDYKAQGPEKCTASILFASTFGRPLYSSGMQFSTDHIALMEMGKRSTEAESVRGPLFSGEEGAVYRCNRVLPSPFPPSPLPTPPPPPPAGCLACAWRSETVATLAAVCLFLVICLSFCLLYPRPITGPQPPCISALARLRTLRGSFRSYSV